MACLPGRGKGQCLKDLGPLADDTADRPLRPGRLPSNSKRIAWERAGVARGLWLCCVGRPSPIGIGLSPRLARDPSALPPFPKFLLAFALTLAFIALLASASAEDVKVPGGLIDLEFIT